MNKRVCLCVIAASLTMMISFTLQAQNIPFISPDLCAALPAEDAPEACMTFAQCVDSQSDLLDECEQELYHSMLQHCTEPKCENDTLYSLSIMSIAASHRVERSESDSFQNTLEMALFFYREQDVSGATMSLTRLYEDYPHRLLPYAAGLAYENAGYFDQALAEYEKAIGTQFFTSLAFYSRGYLHAELGDTIRADQDFYTFSELRTRAPDLNLMSLVVPQVAVSNLVSDSETWMLYPLSAYGSSPGGESVAYLFDAPARVIEVMHFEESNTLAILDFQPSVFDRSVPRALFFDCEGDTCVRSLAFQETFLGLNAGGTFLTLSLDGDYAEMEQIIWGSESGSWMYWVMLPQNAEDPRPEVPCENGVYPILGRGDEVYANPDWMPITVYADADSTSNVVVEVTNDQPATIRISSNLNCGAGGNWWQVTVDGSINGWVTDSDGGSYSLVPADWQPRRSVAELLSLP